MDKYTVNCVASHFISTMAIKNIIFDLGGVLYKIDYHKVTEKFQELPSTSGSKLNFKQSAQDPLFDNFETGKITPAEFRNGIRELYQIEISDQELDDIWNAMLIGVFPGRNQLVEKMAKNYQTCLLSNANQIHYDFIENDCQHIFNHLGKIYFSFQIGMRKPHKEIFQFVLEDRQWKAEETLFVEDSIQHILGAQAVGIQTLFLEDPETLDFQLEQILQKS